MSRYRGPRLRIVRRIGKLRGLTRKKPFQRILQRFDFSRQKVVIKVIPPGQHGLKKLFKTRQYNSCEDDFLIRLKVKQRLRYNYGLSERQLIKYIKNAKKVQESTGQFLLKLLEMRLDNIVFRLNMAPTIPSARQLISHGHIKVNNKKLTIPSYICQPKDVISVSDRVQSLFLINTRLKKYKKSKKINLLKKRLERTLAYLLLKLKVTPNFQSSLRLISQGKIFINKKKILAPNHLCNKQDILELRTELGIKQLDIKKAFPYIRKNEKKFTRLKKTRIL
nr:ribosomal protein S4 [Elakatothrix viridis]